MAGIADIIRTRMWRNRGAKYRDSKEDWAETATVARACHEGNSPFFSVIFPLILTLLFSPARLI